MKQKFMFGVWSRSTFGKDQMLEVKRSPSLKRSPIVRNACYGSSIRDAQIQFLGITSFVVLLCLCVSFRVFHGDIPTYVRRPYAIPKKFITSECGDERRLGNTMFAYASLLGIAHSNNLTAVISDSIRLKRVFNLTALTTDDLSNTIGHYDTFEEYGKRGCAFDVTMMELSSRLNIKLMGYLQSWKYFQHIEEAIRRNFAFSDDVKRKAQAFLYEVLLMSTRGYKKTVLVGIHVRRGDMAEGYFTNYGYVTAPAEYFHKAMNYFRRKHADLWFIVCSDDVTWAKENLRGENVVFSEGNSDAVDLAILSSCDHVIVSVGSFGWWAAWLANGTTIYYGNWPRPFTQLEYQVEKRDYFPPHWISMT